MAEKCMHHPKIDVRFDTVLEAVGSSPDGESGDDGSVGDGCLRWARLRDRATGETIEYRARRGMTFGVFVFAGFIPNTTLVRDFVDLDDPGYIRVDAKQRTNVPGVYAAGDVCAKDLRQVVTAVADGAVAALDMQYLASDMQGKTCQIPPAPVPRY
nr:FAD-dependent oxidoreductase [Bifidobacterium callitrichos]